MMSSVNCVRRRMLVTAGYAVLSTMAKDSSAQKSELQTRPIPRTGGPWLKTSLNAYSFSKPLNDAAKMRGAGMSLFQLLEYCAEHGALLFPVHFGAPHVAAITRAAEGFSLRFVPGQVD